MFPQTYGTQYYGKRYPIETKQQISGSANSSVFMSYTRVFLIHLIAVAKGIATFNPLDVIKKLLATVSGRVTLKKKISFALIVTCENIGKTTKHIISLPITAISKTTATIKKQAQKTLSAIATSLASITKHRLLEFEFIGSFAPGDVVKIDSKTLEITLNGENVLHLVKKADFPVIQKGEQALIYSDKEGNRMVKVTVKWRDRWL